MKTLLVILGGAAGTALRFGVSSLAAATLGPRTFPIATFFINLTGSFAIGFLAAYFDARAAISPAVRAALLTGVLGGYTTFSSFSLETLQLLRAGAWLPAMLYSAGSLVLGLAAVWCGALLARVI
jgi:fluoride exporter